MAQWKALNSVKHGCRRWLNPIKFIKDESSQGGWVMTMLKVRKGERWHSGTIRIGDCARFVEIDIVLDSPKARDAACAKLDILAAEILRLRNKLSQVKYVKREKDDNL